MEWCKEGRGKLEGIVVAGDEGGGDMKGFVHAPYLLLLVFLR